MFDPHIHPNCAPQGGTSSVTLDIRLYLFQRLGGVSLRLERLQTDAHSNQNGSETFHWPAATPWLKNLHALGEARPLVLPSSAGLPAPRQSLQPPLHLSRGLRKPALTRQRPHRSGLPPSCFPLPRPAAPPPPLPAPGALPASSSPPRLPCPRTLDGLGWAGEPERRHRTGTAGHTEGHSTRDQG